MYNGLARKQVSLPERDCCSLCAGLTLQQDAEGRYEGDFHLSPNWIRTNVAARPPSPRSGRRCSCQWLAGAARAASKRRIWSLYLVWVRAKVVLQPTANTKTPPAPFFHLLRFVPPHVRATRSSTATTDTTTSTSHPRSRSPPLISALNLVLLLRLMSLRSLWSEPFQRDSPEPPRRITAAITGFFADTVWRFKMLRDSKQNRASWSSDKPSYREGAFAKTLCDMMIGRQAQILYEYGYDCLCL